MVEESDLVVAEASFPSVGLGIEMQVADQAGIPIILAFGRCFEMPATPIDYSNPDGTRHQLQIGDGSVSLMARGVPSVLQYIQYESEAEGQQRLSAAVENAVNTSLVR